MMQETPADEGACGCARFLAPLLRLSMHISKRNAVYADKLIEEHAQQHAFHHDRLVKPLQRKLQMPCRFQMLDRSDVS